MLRLTTTERNQKVLNYLGFQYIVKRINKMCVEWRCRNRFCSSTLTFSADNSTLRRCLSVHCESCKTASPSKIVIEETMAKMKKRAREETKSISKIYREEIVAAQMSNPGMATGLFFTTLSDTDSTLCRHRATNCPTLPKKLSELILTGE